MKVQYQENMVEKISQAGNDYFGIIMGWSYSLRGIHLKELRHNFFNFSWHGMDLYYNWKLYSYGRKIGAFHNIKRLFLVVPYAFFNYDQSRSPYQYRTCQLFAVHELDDWHNVLQIPEPDLSNSMNYIINWQMFGKRITSYYAYHFQYDRAGNTCYSGQIGTAHLDPIWWKVHTNTVSENRKILRDMLECFKKQNVEIDIIIPPYFIEAFDIESRKRMPEIKESFYNIVLNEVNRTGTKVCLYDCFSCFKNHEFFADTTHLNGKGAAEWTRMLNEKLLLRENLI